MKKSQLIILVSITLLVVSCKVKQVDLSKVYDSCWIDKPDNGLDSELCFYKDHTAKLTTVSVVGGKSIRSITNYTYNYVNDKIYLSPNEGSELLYARLYAIIDGNTLKLSNDIPNNSVTLKKAE